MGWLHPETCPATTPPLDHYVVVLAEFNRNINSGRRFIGEIFEEVWNLDPPYQYPAITPDTLAIGTNTTMTDSNTNAEIEIDMMTFTEDNKGLWNYEHTYPSECHSYEDSLGALQYEHC